MTYPIKIEFKEYPSGSWEDWSAYLATPPNISKRVESENEGEAGVIVFDIANVSFRYDTGNPVHDVFSIDLTEVQRYLFKISFPKVDKSYVQVFEGMADFLSLRWNEFSNVISFDVVDKLSALGILYAVQSRTAVSVKDRVQLQLPSNQVIDFIFSGVEDELWIASAVSSELGVPYDDFSAVVVNVGEVLSVPEKNTPLGTDYDFKYHVVVESTLASHPVWPALTFNKLKILPYHANVSNYTYRYEGDTMDDIGCLSKEVYGVDVNNIVADSLVSLSGIKIIEALYEQAWGATTVVLKPVDFTFAIPSGYAVLLIDEEPLGSDPLGAIKILSDSMKCYIYVNKAGELVIQSKEALGTSGTTRTIGTTKVIKRQRKYFWDKLADGATVTIKSWITDEFGENLEGSATRTKQVPGSLATIKPKNLITKNFLTSSPDDNTVELLIERAAEEADEILNFYGLRRSSYDLVLNLDDNTINWELIDNIELDSLDYFFTSMDFDGRERTVSLEPVEVLGHEYDIRQIVVPLGDDSILNSIINGGAASSTGVLTNAAFNKEVPSGTINGENKTFTLVKIPNTTFIFVFRNAAYQELNEQYTLSGNTITFKKAPIAGDKLKVLYV